MWKLFLLSKEKKRFKQEKDVVREKLIIHFHNTVRLYNKQYAHYQECLQHNCNETITKRSKEFLDAIEREVTEQLQFFKTCEITAKETDELPKHPERIIEVVK